MIWRRIIVNRSLFNSETTWICNCSMVLVIEAIVLDWWIEVAHTIVRHIQIWETFLVNIVIIILAPTLRIWTPINPISVCSTTAKQLDLLLANVSKYQRGNLRDYWQVCRQTEEDQVVKSVYSIVTIHESHELGKAQFHSVEECSESQGNWKNDRCCY